MVMKMIISRSIKDLKMRLRKLELEGNKIGLVPTMGYLHEGHMSLIDYSKKENDITVLSIFVNPTQFGENEDLDNYPRDEERDLEQANSKGVDFVFIPNVEEMYKNRKTTVHVSDLTNVLCGKSRPTHFDGVTTIVLKLFNIVRPHKAYFGQKDAQQVIVIEKMVNDLDMDTKIIVCPIVREEDGLAMSSRNVYLSSLQRKDALSLNRALSLVKEKFKAGEKNSITLKSLVRKEIESIESATIDYISLVDFENLEEIKIIDKKAIVLLAVFVGKTRLIDNIILEENLC